jgi:ribose transport system substrate-binding protein
VMSLKPAGILVSAGDAAAMKGPIDAAIAQGIPVITVDSDVPDSKRLTFIGTNNYQAGFMGGRVLAERLHGKGDIVVYTIAGQENADERLRGYKSVLDGHPQIKIVRTVDVKGDPRIAFDSTVEIAKGKPIPDGFICLVAIACPEVADVLDRNNIQNKVIVAMDTPSSTLDWIKKGRIAATISQKPYTMGQYGLVMLDALHHYKLPSLDANWAQDTHSPFPAFIDTGATLIDQTNLDAFRKAQGAAAGGN